MVLAMPRVEVVVPRRRAAERLDIGPLARILKRLRGEMGLRQKDVVRRAGWNVDDQQGYYSSLETGAIQNPGDDKLEALDRAFELAPGSIRYWLKHGPPWATLREDSPTYDAMADDEIMALLRLLPPHRREEASEILRRQAIEALKVMTREAAG